MNRVIAQRLEKQTIPITECGCWIWMGCLTKAGYGQLRWNGKSMYTHRLSYEVHKGKIPKGIFVLHSCDTRACINPDHLFLGTQLDNMRDMFAKGRHRTDSYRGERHPCARLTEEQVRIIRASPKSNTELAREYGVKQPNICNIRKRKKWAHVL